MRIDDLHFKNGAGAPDSLVLDSNNLETILGMTVEYPYAMDATELTYFPIPWHWHAELEFIMVLEGSEDIVTNNGIYTARAGEAYFLNTNVLDMKKHSDGVGKTLEIGHLFHPVFISGHFGSVIENDYMNPILKDPSLELVLFTRDTENGIRFTDKIRELTELQLKGMETNQRYAIETRNILSAMWLILTDEVKNNRAAHSLTSTRGSDRIRPMMQFITRHYGEKISLSDIASTAYISDRECLRIFKKELGRTPFEYLTDIRLERARVLLTGTDKDITQIALECGFSDSSYFSRIFKKNFDMTPREYRIKYSPPRA